MFPWIAAITGRVVLQCPHCGFAQSHGRHGDPVQCKKCRRAFGRDAGLEARRRDQAKRHR